MEKQTVFIKVSLEERLPQIETKVQTIHTDIFYGERIEVMVLDKKGNWFFYPSDVHGCEPEFWLEEIELPNEEKVHEESVKYYGNSPGERSLNIFKHGARFMRNHLK